MRQTCAAGGEWKSKLLDDADAWFGIRLEKSMESVLGEADHVKVFRQFFVEGLDKADAWLVANSHLKIRGFLPKKRGEVTTLRGTRGLTIASSPL
jgi:hypothetical protein